MEESLIINGSDVAAICGLNPYKQTSDTLIEFIRKNNPDVFEIISRYSPDDCIHWKKRAKMATENAQCTIRDAVQSNEKLEELKDEIRKTSNAEDVVKNVQAITAEVYTRRGSAEEKASIDKYEQVSQSSVTERNSTLLTTMIWIDENTKCEIRGMIDGIEADKVFEHKRRQRRLFNRVPIYENVQCHVYMKMTGLMHAKLLETFQEEAKSHIIRFDDTLWDDIVRRIKIFIVYYHKIVGLLFNSESAADVQATLSHPIDYSNGEV